MNGGALAGCNVVVTRPAEHSAEMADAIESAGGTAIRFPVMDIIGRDGGQVVREFSAHPAPNVVIYISQNAVKYGGLPGAGLSAKVAAVGPATAAALAALGTPPDIVPAEGFDSESLLAHPSLQNISGQSVTIVRGNDGRELLAETLKSRGADVHYLSVYERHLHKSSDFELAALQAAFNGDGVSCVTIMSVQSLQNFLQLMPTSYRDQLRQTLLVAPSARVIQTANEMIPETPTALSPGPEVKDMVNTLIANWQSGQD